MTLTRKKGNRNKSRKIKKVAQTIEDQRDKRTGWQADNGGYFNRDGSIHLVCYHKLEYDAVN